MRKLLLIVLSFVFVISCKKEIQNDTNFSQKVDVSNFQEVSEISTVAYEGLEPWLQNKDDKTYVVNFWATWCLPCIKELPYFEYLNQEYKSRNVEVILVSLDFPNQKEARLIPFINKKKLQSKIIHLDDPNEQVWIGKVHEKWTGAIPATLIYNKDNRKFFEQSFTYEELENELKQFLN